MIKSITVINYLGDSITLDLWRPEQSGFLVQKIEGLGPSKANIHVTEMASNDGALYNSARTTSRNIVFSLKFLFKPTIEDVRQLSYKYFPIKKPVTLFIETDNRTCKTYGYVESNEPDIFSASETTQISIVCPDPYFYSLEGETTIFSGIESSFEFPFSNESLTENIIEFGNITNQTSQTVYYSGDAEVGIIITIHALGMATNISIYNPNANEIMKLSTVRLAELTGSGIMAGDDIIISTVKGNKYIFLLRNGVYTNIINCLDKNSDWFQLTNGDNLFIYTAEIGTSNLQFRIENETVYEGV